MCCDKHFIRLHTVKLNILFVVSSGFSIQVLSSEQLFRRLQKTTPRSAIRVTAVYIARGAHVFQLQHAATHAVAGGFHGASDCDRNVFIDRSDFRTRNRVIEDTLDEELEQVQIVFRQSVSHVGGWIPNGDHYTVCVNNAVTTRLREVSGFRTEDQEHEFRRLVFFLAATVFHEVGHLAVMWRGERERREEGFILEQSVVGGRINLRVDRVVGLARLHYQDTRVLLVIWRPTRLIIVPDEALLGFFDENYDLTQLPLPRRRRRPDLLA